jgi:hypothetical protein
MAKLNPPDEPAKQTADKQRINPPEADKYGKSENNQLKRVGL